MNTFMKSKLKYLKNPCLFKMLERTLMYNFEVDYKPGYQMAVAYCGLPCTEGAHEDFITRNNEIGITVKSF